MYTIQRFYKQCLQVNQILNILDTNIDVITKENMYIHDPFVGVCVNNFKEYMDNRAYYIICLKRLLEFHGIEVHTMYNDVKDGENSSVDGNIKHYYKYKQRYSLRPKI